ncbi:MAG: hypothetical protein WCD12_22510 [Candidatus Binatus sp.]|uniref:hypothetical protein n=1 Tax=Candidatus Binatus sp. TaxID=2811406 RepID=UPI003C76B8AA
MIHEVERDAAAAEIDRVVNAAPIAVVGEVDGAAGADAALDAMDAELLKSAQQLAAVVEKATEQVSASPQKRCADLIAKAVEYLKPNSNVAQVRHVASQISAFARQAEDYLMRGDHHALDGAIVTFWNGVRDADKLASPLPPLMPSGDTVFYFAGWSAEETIGLRNILGKGLCGVTMGDRAISIDKQGADLASGKRISKKEALDAYVPPAYGKLIAVGSLPRVLAVLRALQ